MSIHDGHRQRMKERFLREGLDNFTEYQVLELLLFYCIPRQDTNVIAHRLISRFGSMSQVLEAPVRELKKVEGVGENAAIYLTLMKETARYYDVDRARQKQILPTVEECGEYLRHFFVGKKNETVYLLCLDAKCMVLGCYKVSEGGLNSAGVSARKVIDIALAANATSVILAHNHPSGLALPSADDIRTTKRLAKALHMVDVILTDYIVVADDDHISLARSNMYSADDIALDE